MTVSKRLGGARLISGAGNHKWISGEIGNCTIQMHREPAHIWSYKLYAKPQSDRTPIGPLLDSVGVTIPESRTGGMILIGYLNRVDREYGYFYEGETVNCIKLEIRVNPTAKKNDWQYDVICPYIDEKAETFFKTSGVTMEFPNVPNLTEIREKAGIKQDKAA